MKQQGWTSTALSGTQISDFGIAKLSGTIFGATVSETAEPAEQPIFMTYAPGFTNYAMVALRLLTAAGLVIGGILLIVGGSMNANVNEFSVALNGADPVPGFGALIWGGSIFSIGIIAAFSLLAAMAVRWTPPK